MTRPFRSPQLRFYLTAVSACPYLPGRRERKVFTGLDGPEAAALNDSLTHAGFRRSQNIAYRPACEGCIACVSVRIPVAQFVFSKRWRRVMARNADLTRRLARAEATPDQYWLLRRYLSDRHPNGGMAEMGLFDYAAMVEETSVRTHVMEYRYAPGASRGEFAPEGARDDAEESDLAACALVDVLRDGLSLVYSFYDTSDAKRSMGAFIILDHILQAHQVGLPYVYLGYWVKGSDKMGYKADFQPLEMLVAGGWRRMGAEDLI